MASLADISRRAGTSVATASRVLNGSTHPVSEATRARVLAAADELGYQPSALARALVKRSSRIIGVIVNDIVDPYFAEIARGVEDVAGRGGHLVDGVQRRPPASRPSSSTSGALRDYHAAGWCSPAAGTPERRGERAARAGRRGRADPRRARRLPRAARLPRPAPRVDNAAAARDVTEHLIGLGHRRIAVRRGAAGAATRAPTGWRGFGAAMAAAGLPTPARSSPAASTSRPARPRRAACSTPRPLPDAVVAANDEAAIGVLTGLRQAGVDVPGDVSVAGIDDTRPARFVDLTTVSLPLYDLGAAAARHIIEGAPADPLTLAHRVVPRGSTAPR